MTLEHEEEQILPLEIPVIITQKNSLPAIELRKLSSRLDIMKGIVACAIHNRPLIIQPVFRNKMQSLASLAKNRLAY